MALIELSSLNSINEIYQSESELCQARRTTDNALKAIALTCEPIILPRYPDIIMTDYPCSEYVYFDIVQVIKNEVRDNMEGEITFTLRTSFIWEEYGTLEIVNKLPGDRFNRHQFVLHNDNIKEIYNIIGELLVCGI
jgi:hypothetical protein